METDTGDIVIMSACCTKSVVAKTRIGQSLGLV